MIAIFIQTFPVERASVARTLTPAPFPACGRKRQEEENEGAGLAPSCSPSPCKRGGRREIPCARTFPLKTQCTNACGSAEQRAGMQADRERQLRRREFLRLLRLGLEHLDLAALAGDAPAFGPDLDHLADLALDGAESPHQMLPRVEDLDLL